MSLVSDLADRSAVRGKRAMATTSDFRWSRPPTGHTKMNIDAGVFPDGSVGLGFIVCDDEGRALLAGVKRVFAPPDNSTLIEAMTLRFGIEQASRHDMRIQIFESDSKNLIKCLKGSYSGDVATMVVVGYILDWAGPMDAEEFVFASRNSNRVANCLAQWDPSLNSMYVWIDETPPCCNSFLVDDVRREPLNLD
ncbi:hypothetical protein ACS0TY_006709 [Phlomoides rotata]